MDRVTRLPSCITHRPLHTYQILFKLENYLQSDKRPFKPALSDRLRGDGLQSDQKLQTVHHRKQSNGITPRQRLPAPLSVGR